MVSPGQGYGSFSTGSMTHFFELNGLNETLVILLKFYLWTVKRVYYRVPKNRKTPKFCALTRQPPTITHNINLASANGLYKEILEETNSRDFMERNLETSIHLLACGHFY